METHLKLYHDQSLGLKVAEWKKQGHRIVFTNGCFDILHLGHIDILEKANQLGDKLVVGVNSDASVKRLKGLNRPINNEYVRMRMLAAFESVDAVVKFDEDTPLRLIESLKPNILVKGSDYEKGNIVGADVVIQNGGEVNTIKFLKGYSTSNVIDKIKKNK